MTDLQNAVTALYHMFNKYFKRKKSDTYATVKHGSEYISIKMVARIAPAILVNLLHM